MLMLMLSWLILHTLFLHQLLLILLIVVDSQILTALTAKLSSHGCVISHGLEIFTAIEPPILILSTTILIVVSLVISHVHHHHLLIFLLVLRHDIHMRVLLLRCVIRKDAWGEPLRKHSRCHICKGNLFPWRLYLEGAIGVGLFWLPDIFFLHNHGRRQLLCDLIRILLDVTTFFLPGTWVIILLQLILIIFIIRWGCLLERPRFKIDRAHIGTTSSANHGRVFIRVCRLICSSKCAFLLWFRLSHHLSRCGRCASFVCLTTTHLVISCSLLYSSLLITSNSKSFTFV